ncbi:HD domain-containing protein [Fimicolochytrium jonesii]|uniref:HD domain-containing protein n=1 Tax=Fimicolochytrium jonesii TaxID=1396493 RepID=UPI0022FE049F|nr:HD domain-containing protein [Fimicolochytrium jonesii]KAI8826922.1 HD domain-containing protein [Fimicolochytrium jonesii]
MSTPAGVLRFLHVIENLKRTKRTGWVDNKIGDAESISDHMHRMGVLALLINDKSLDRTKCIKMAIVHDLAESIAGDITPHSGVSKEEKFRLEKEGMDEVVRHLDSSPEALEIRSLWTEYEEATTEEALYVKDLDKFEMIVQAFEYEKRHNMKLDTFYASTEGKFRHPTVRKWVEELYREREQLHADLK